MDHLAANTRPTPASSSTPTTAASLRVTARAFLFRKNPKRSAATSSGLRSGRPPAKAAMAPRLLLLPLPLLLQLGAVAAASYLLAASYSVGAAPPPSHDASATVDDVAAGVVIYRGARRLGPALHLSDIPADAPAPAAYDYDYDYGDYSIPAADAPPAFPGADADDDADAAADRHFPSTSLDFALISVVCVLATIAGSAVLALLVVGLIKGAAFVAGLCTAAKAAREKATRVRALDHDAVEAAGH